MLRFRVYLISTMCFGLRYYLNGSQHTRAHIAHIIMSSSIQATVAKRVDYLLRLLRVGLRQMARPGQSRGRIDYLLRNQAKELAELFTLRPNIVSDKEYEGLVAMAREHGYPFEAPNADDELQGFARGRNKEHARLKEWVREEHERLEKLDREEHA